MIWVSYTPCKAIFATRSCACLATATHAGLDGFAGSHDDASSKSPADLRAVPGAKGETQEMFESDKTHSVMMGYLLWIFGFIGAHRFYYGRQISGTIWFFTLGLLLVGWLIDLLLIPSMSRDADARFTFGETDYNLTWILLTFLGVFGVHRFYMGKIFSGLIYLCTLGLFGVGILYDFLTLNEQISRSNAHGSR
jgi:TM2 domain-containing membrane protein YozV